MEGEIILPSISYIYIGDYMYRIYVGEDIINKETFNEDGFREKIKLSITKKIEASVHVSKYEENTVERELKELSPDIFVNVIIEITKTINEIIAYTNEDNIMSNGLTKEIYRKVKELFKEEERRDVRYLNKVTSKNIICSTEIPAAMIVVKMVNIDEEKLNKIIENISMGIEGYFQIKFC